MKIVPALEAKRKEAQLCGCEPLSPTISSSCAHIFNACNNVSLTSFRDD